ncbi:Centrosomal protein of 41 kDa [Phytophthora pseudosyringae]|uniref:Centrosomal protein of 41 kDa n=1 Tax=Phytophthora pseudosyringae TaxID=221518 RepID=A0A8T1VVR9_9STRA|nr:Centrosomal protein of 41 kDa [Phytophthora pseudosyringae]
MEARRGGPRLSLLVRATDDGPFTPSAVCLWWVGLLSLHLVGGVFFGLVFAAYWNMPGLELTTFLDFYKIGMNSKDFRAIATTHGVIAALHALSAFAMITRSIRNKKLTFRSNSRSLSQVQEGVSQHKSERRRGRTGGVFNRCFAAVFGRRGFFGVEGPYYDLLLLCRETIETALQTSQGLRMSRNIPRLWLNRFYVALLVLNCWSTALVHHMFRRNKTKMRLVALLSDCLLDLVTSVGIPLLLVISYAQEFDTATGDFNILRWFQDRWLVNATNEFNIILVLSWGDLATRMVFAVSMLSNLNTMEGLMTAATTEDYHGVPTNPRGATIAPFDKTDARAESHTNNVAVWTDRLASSKLMRSAFFGWGVVIMGLHIHAETNPMLPQCLVQVHPWGVSKPACSLVLLNCLTDGTEGESAHVITQWSQFDANSVGSLLVRNCPNFTVPPMLTTFHALKTFKVYNTTILEWGEDAAFNQADHPKMQVAMLIRVNLTNGELPPGLVSPTFPPTLNIIGFVVSNLRVFPGDLHTKWPRYSAVHLDTTQFTEFPDTLWKIRPSVLIMPYTPIESVPKELFELESMWYLDLAGTKLSQLPVDVPMLVNPLVGINLGDTNIASFPSWIDPWLQRTANSFAPPLAAAGSPYCIERGLLFSGNRTDFSPSTSAVSLATMSTLMDPSAANRAFLANAVKCEPSSLYRYALAFEDTFQSF